MPFDHLCRNWGGGGREVQSGDVSSLELPLTTQ